MEAEAPTEEATGATEGPLWEEGNFPTSRGHRLLSDSVLVKAVEELLGVLFSRACHDEAEALALAALAVFNDTPIDRWALQRRVSYLLRVPALCAGYWFEMGRVSLREGGESLVDCLIRMAGGRSLRCLRAGKIDSKPENCWT